MSCKRIKVLHTNMNNRSSCFMVCLSQICFKSWNSQQRMHLWSQPIVLPRPRSRRQIAVPITATTTVMTEKLSSHHHSSMLMFSHLQQCEGLSHATLLYVDSGQTLTPLIEVAESQLNCHCSPVSNFKDTLIVLPCLPSIDATETFCYTLW